MIGTPERRWEYPSERIEVRHGVQLTITYGVAEIEDGKPAPLEMGPLPDFPQNTRTFYLERMTMAKKKTAAAYIKYQIKEHRYWCKHNAEEVKKDYEKDIQEELTENNFDSAKVITLPLSIFGLYYGTRGLLSLIDGDEKGWTDIDLAMEYRYWEVKFNIGARFRAIHQDIYASDLYLEMPDLASLLCWAYVSDQTKRREELWTFLQRVLSTREAITENYWGPAAEGMYELFVFQMFAKAPFGKGAKLPEYLKKETLGPYAAVLDNWDQPDSLAEPLREICDYHAQAMEHRNLRQDPSPPFRSAPFDLVPIEILAIYKLRKALGLETPEIEHPLLDLPTASRAPRKLTKIDDPIFARVQRLYDEQCQYPWPLK